MADLSTLVQLAGAGLIHFCVVSSAMAYLILLFCVCADCRHTGRFLVLWLTCLPFVIWQELGWFSVPISMVVSFLLFGIEEIGVQIEEPFGILALEVRLLC